MQATSYIAHRLWYNLPRGGSGNRQAESIRPGEGLGVVERVGGVDVYIAIRDLTFMMVRGTLGSEHWRCNRGWLRRE